MPAAPGREARAGDPLVGGLSARGLVLGAHALLVGLWIAWHLVEGTPGTASALGGSFATSVAGRAAALVTLLLGVLALAAIVVLTLPRWRDVRLSGLFVALIAALALRRGVDALDLVYAGLVALVAVAWFDGERRRRARAAAR